MNKPANDVAPRVLNLFCQKTRDTWVVHAGRGEMPMTLSPFFNPDRESGKLLLDFEYLEELLRDKGATCEKRVSKYGSVELTAHGTNTQVLANWLGSAMASSVIQTRA